MLKNNVLATNAYPFAISITGETVVLPINFEIEMIYSDRNVPERIEHNLTVDTSELSESDLMAIDDDKVVTHIRLDYMVRNGLSTKAEVNVWLDW